MHTGRKRLMELFMTLNYPGKVNKFLCTFAENAANTVIIPEVFCEYSWKKTCIIPSIQYLCISSKELWKISAIFMKSAIAATPLPFFRSGVRIPGLDQG
jgi:hypothetical protein